MYKCFGLNLKLVDGLEGEDLSDEEDELDEV